MKMSLNRKALIGFAVVACFALQERLYTRKLPWYFFEALGCRDRNLVPGLYGVIATCIFRQIACPNRTDLNA